MIVADTSGGITTMAPQVFHPNSCQAPCAQTDTQSLRTVNPLSTCVCTQNCVSLSSYTSYGVCNDSPINQRHKFTVMFIKLFQKLLTDYQLLKRKTDTDVLCFVDCNIIIQYTPRTCTFPKLIF